MQSQQSLINNTIKIGEGDYFQSANSLFHFMKEEKYLQTALLERALTPRYCREDISYLNLNKDDHMFNEIAIPQKCFCDIPLHNITSKLHKQLRPQYNDHTSVYGEFAIAFSKQWGELHNLQPVQYINETSTYLSVLQKDFNKLINADDLSDDESNAVLYRLSFIKPLRGRMPRNIEGKHILISKNFHDEQEWRYVPDPIMIRKYNNKSKYQFQPIIANPNTLNFKIDMDKNFLDVQSEELAKQTCRDLWLNFNYNDIRYLIVPNIQARINCINYIWGIPDEYFDTDNDVVTQKLVLISKILVLDEIRKDW